MIQGHAVHRRGMLALSIAAMLAAPAYGQGAATPDTPDALSKAMTEIYAATQANDQATARTLTRALVLPNHQAWFARVFGEAVSVKLAAEYAAAIARFDSDVAGAFGGVVQKGQSDIAVLRFDQAGDPRAVGNQNDALAAMIAPQPLYSVRFVKPGERLGLHLYSFVHAEGAFRYVGRMTAAKR